ARAIPAPTPWPAPVTSATRPVRSNTRPVSARVAFGERGGDAHPSLLDVAGVGVDADEVPPGLDRGHGHRPHPAERVEGGVLAEGEQLDAPARELGGERRGMTDAAGRLRREPPGVEREL